MTHVQYNKPRSLCFASVMTGKLFLTVATLALLHGIEFLFDISSITPRTEWRSDVEPRASRSCDGIEMKSYGGQRVATVTA
jgi:hypothetical protein